MNWLTKLRKFGENIKTAVTERIKKSEINTAGFVSCCRGPILESALIENFYQCPDCLKTFPISPKMRFKSLFLKNEYEQKTGSFKIRGAYYKIKSLTDDQKSKGVVAASAGNHSQGVAFFVSFVQAAIRSR